MGDMYLPSLHCQQWEGQLHLYPNDSVGRMSMVHKYLELTNIIACLSTILPIPLSVTVPPNTVILFLREASACFLAMLSSSCMFFTMFEKSSVIGLVSGIGSNQHQADDFMSAWNGVWHQGGSPFSG